MAAACTGGSDNQNGNKRSKVVKAGEPRSKKGKKKVNGSGKPPKLEQDDYVKITHVPRKSEVSQLCCFWLNHIEIHSLLLVNSQVAMRWHIFLRYVMTFGCLLSSPLPQTQVKQWLRNTHETSPVSLLSCSPLNCSFSGFSNLLL